ncbi:MAG: aconitate hydratase AcnA [Alphaproteobacteria bacterium]|nr:aconitate hydratase AcnA [Alphaproteobacteria bacterium]
MVGNLDSFNTQRTLSVDGIDYRYFSLSAAAEAGIGDVSRLPYSLKVLLENLLRHEDEVAVTAADIAALGAWAGHCRGGHEISFHPARVMMPDSSGVPLLADLAAMRDAMGRLGGDPAAINPMVPLDFIIDHSVVVDHAGAPDALDRNMANEFARNEERYRFLKWGQQAFRNLRVLPPGVGICHQINLEYLSRVVWTEERDGHVFAYPDCLLGMDSHTPMVNGLGVVGWGVGGLEAGAAMLGQPVSMLVPDVVGCRLVGGLRTGVTATDLVLSITKMLRDQGVVQKFVEFCGPALDGLPTADRTTIANMAPEYGATMGYFPVDRETVAYLTQTGRDAAQVALVEAYAKAQGMWREAGSPEPAFSELVEFDLDAVEPTMAGPRRPQEKTPLGQVPASFQALLPELADGDAEVPVGGTDYAIRHGDIAIAAITSCTNTSNPDVMIGAGLLARNAVAKGLKAKPWVKTSLGPGSRVVAAYLEEAGLMDPLEALGFHVVGYGCTTCMGNSGPLDPPLADSIEAGGVVMGAVHSGNRNFEGRAHPQCKVNYLASPPLVVASALAGSLNIDLTKEPLGEGADGAPVMLRDIWPDRDEVQATIARCVTPDMFQDRYEGVDRGGVDWQALDAAGGDIFAWEPGSTYIRRPPFFDDMTAEVPPVGDITGARALAVFGDFLTTDHISPVSAIPPDSLAGEYLQEQQVAAKDLSSYAQRRVNHDVMLRATFNQTRIRNEMCPGTEGGVTRHMPDNEEMPIFEAARRYRADNVPMVVIGGRDYGQGSSRDWAAKGTRALGVTAVIAEGLERIHRSNLIGMGVLPLQFPDGVTRLSLGLDGSESFDLTGLEQGIEPGMTVMCRITRSDGGSESVALICRLDTAIEVAYYRHGGSLHYVLRGMLSSAS